MYSTDILIEDAKNHLKTWGSQPPTFLLCNGALTAQLVSVAANLLVTECLILIILID
tara:strand:+ start:242 stop:412 length:171 start_codon:yes stop_codon:yes gene_type:complete